MADIDPIEAFKLGYGIVDAHQTKKLQNKLRIQRMETNSNSYDSDGVFSMKIANEYYKAKTALLRAGMDDDVAHDGGMAAINQYKNPKKPVLPASIKKPLIGAGNIPAPGMAPVDPRLSLNTLSPQNNNFG